MSDTAAAQTKWNTPPELSVGSNWPLPTGQERRSFTPTCSAGNPVTTQWDRTWSTRSTKSTAKTSPLHIKKAARDGTGPDALGLLRLLSPAPTKLPRKLNHSAATVVQEPFDVMDHGRMAAITDPTGATFCIWQPKPAQRRRHQERTQHALLERADDERHRESKGFLHEALRLEDQRPTPAAMPYTEWINGEEHIGGMMQIQPDMGPMPPNWGLYFAVDDCDGKVAQAHVAWRAHLCSTDRHPKRRALRGVG